MGSAPGWLPRAAAWSSPGAAPRAASASYPPPPDKSGRSDRGSGDPIGSFTFTTRQRLRNKAEFDRVYQRGRRYSQTFFQAVACSNELGFARLGLSIASRVLPTAVGRNRVRRLVREVFRHCAAGLPAIDVIVSTRNPARTAGVAELRADLERLLMTVRDRCARSSQPLSPSTGSP